MLQQLEDGDDEVTSIYIEPPEPNIDSDEDSAEEDEGGLIDNLTGKQLLAGAEVVFTNKERLGGEELEDASMVDNMATTENAEKKRRRTKTGKQQRNWTHQDLHTNMPLFPEANFSKYRDFTAHELFELFFDDDVFDMFLTEITRYALFKNSPDPKVTKEELKCFIGVLLVSGYNKLPGKRFYWDVGSDMRNEMVCGAIRRDRFTQIMRFLHVADNNTIDLSDKMYKLRPLMDKLSYNFRKHFVPVGKLSFDESMIAYFGPHGCKQFIKGKPIRFGYKMWCLNTPTGYLVNFDLYQGKNPKGNQENEKKFGKAAAVLVQMIDDFHDHVKALPFSFYFDNLFTGINLLIHLKEQGYNGTGTIRENRVPKECGVLTSIEVKKKERGYLDYKSSDDGVLITRWNDNSSVTVASTVHPVFPLGNVKRYSKEEKKYLSVPRPLVVSQYNKNMGGTDLMDENINRHRIAIRGKKWWWPIFTWLLDVAVQNAWQIHRSAGSTFTALQFRRELARFYLMSYGCPPKGAGRPSSSKQSSSGTRLSESIRFDGRDHYVIQNEGNKRRRCASDTCMSVVRTACTKCNVGLCIPCFLSYHTRQ